MRLDLAKHIVDIDGIAVGALIGRLRDSEQLETRSNRA